MGAVEVAAILPGRNAERRLEEEASSFAQLVNETRRELAEQYLSRLQLTLGQAAYLLGFSEQSSFFRACKRWFGAFLEVVDFVVAHARSNPNAVFAGSVPYLTLAGQLVVGWQMARALLAAERKLAEGTQAGFMRAKVSTARFFADHVLSQAPSLRDRVVEGAGSVTALALESF